MNQQSFLFATKNTPQIAKSEKSLMHERSIFFKNELIVEQGEGGGSQLQREQQHEYSGAVAPCPRVPHKGSDASLNETIEELDDWALILGQKSNNTSGSLNKATKLYRRMRVNFVVSTPRHARPNAIASFINSFRHALSIAADQEGKNLQPSQLETCWVQIKGGKNASPVGQVHRRLGFFTSPTNGKKVYCHAALDVAKVVLRDVENLRIKKIMSPPSAKKLITAPKQETPRCNSRQKKKDPQEVQFRTKDALKNNKAERREAMHVEETSSSLLHCIHQTDQEAPVIACPEVMLGDKNETCYPPKSGDVIQSFHAITAHNECSISDENHVAEIPSTSSLRFLSSNNIPSQNYIDAQFLIEEIQKLGQNLLQRYDNCKKQTEMCINSAKAVRERWEHGYM